MKIFIIKCAILGSVMTGFYFLAQYNLSLNYVDDYYPKFTYEAGSLILGISRAHDGIVPDILEKEVDPDHIETPVLNFAFHLSQSPYGPVYYEAIKKKVKPYTTKGIYILSVTPGNISAPASSEDDPAKFSDNYSLLSKVEDINSSPNFEYIRKAFGKALYKSFLKPDIGMRKVHADGWMEVDLHSEEYTASERDLARWRNATIISYKDYEGFYKFSVVRFKSLDQTIKFLKDHGSVFLVRIPVANEILDMENQYMPDFNSKIDQLAKDNKIPYFDFTKSNDEYADLIYDGSHLDKRGAIKFTHALVAEINEYLRRDLQKELIVEKVK